MEPVEYARLIRRRWRVVAACCLVSAVAVWVVTPANPAEQAPEYIAEHTIIRDAAPGTAPQALATFGLHMRTGEVPKRVAKRIGFTGSPVLLARKLTTKIDDQLGTVTVRATAAGRTAASDLANAFAEETVTFLAEQAQRAQQKANADLIERLNQHQASISDLDKQIAAARASDRSPDLIVAQRDAVIRQYSADFELQQKQASQPPPAAGFLTLEPATPELARPKGAGFGVPTSRPARAAGAALLGLVLGVIAVLVVERVDPRINLRGAAERAFQLPVLTEVPFASRLQPFEVLTVTAPASGVAEAYRALRAALLLMPATVLGARRLGRRSRPNAPSSGPVPVPSILGPTGTPPTRVTNGANATPDDAEPQVILVASAAPSEGKTATVANLAASFAETGRLVLVLSCDFRRPSIHEHLGVRQAWGLTDVLDGGPTAPRLADVIKDSTIPGVRIATNGSPLDNFGELAAAGRHVIDEARRLADIVLIDTAPVLVAHDATELIPAVDSVVVVCRSGRTTKEDAARTRELLTRLGATVAGVVLVGAPESDSSYATYYYSEPKSHRRHRLPRLGARRGSGSSADEGGPAVTEPREPSRKRAVI